MTRLNKRFRLKGQSTLEYAFLVAIIAAGIIGMQFYMKRAIQGRVKQAGDEISTPYDSEGMQMSSILTNVKSRSTVNYVTYQFDDEYSVDEVVIQDSNVTKTGSEHLNPW